MTACRYTLAQMMHQQFRQDVTNDSTTWANVKRETLIDMQTCINSNSFLGSSPGMFVKTISKPFSSLPKDANSSPQSLSRKVPLSCNSEATPLPVTPERQSVVSLPGLSPASAGLVELVAAAETTGLLASGGEATLLAVLVHWLDDPVDAGVLADGLVLGVNEDDLEVLVGGVLVDPVAVQDAQVGATTTDTLLSGGAERTLELQLVDTLVLGLACLLLDLSPLLSSVCLAYRKWHPWRRASCGHHGGRGRGR